MATSMEPGVMQVPSQAPQPVQPTCTPVWSNFMMCGTGIGMPPSCPQMTGGVALPGYPTFSQMTRGVASSGSAMPIVSFSPTCTRPPNQRPSPCQIQQTAPSQPVLYAASLPVQFLQAPGLPYIQTKLNLFSPKAPAHYGTPPPVQFLQAPGPQTQLNQFAAQAPAHYAAAPLVQVPQAPGLSQLEQLAAQAPVHCVTPQSVQVLQASGPQTQRNQFGIQVPAHFSAAPPIQIPQTPGLLPIQNQLEQLAAQAPVDYAAAPKVHVPQGPGPQTQWNEFATQAPAHFAAAPPLQYPQTPGPQPGLTRLEQFSTQAPVDYAAAPTVHVPQAPVPQTQWNEFAAQAPALYAAAPPVQVPRGPGPQPIPTQLEQLATQASMDYTVPPLVLTRGPQHFQNAFGTQAPVQYAAPPPVQVLPAPSPQSIQTLLMQLAAQVPIHNAVPLPAKDLQGPGRQHIPALHAAPSGTQRSSNAFSSSVQDLQAAVPLQHQIQQIPVQPRPHIEADRPQKIASVQPRLVPGLQHVQVQQRPIPHYRNQIYRDENQNLLGKGSDFVRLAPVEQWVVSMRGNSESDEGISSIGESVETSPHTPTNNEESKPKGKSRSPAAQVKQYQRLLTFQEKLVIEKGLPKSRLQVEFESGITFLSPRPAHELGIKPISTVPPFKPRDEMSMGNLDGFEVYPRNLPSSKLSLDCRQLSDHLKSEQSIQPVSNYLKPAGTECQQEGPTENQLGRGQEKG